MVNSFFEDAPGTLPALIIGAPEHAGKSILAYNLSKALRNMKDEVPHLILRACPDGEGDWVYEANPDEVEMYRIKGQWTDEFRDRVLLDITRRQVPLIVDTGGKPTDKDNDIIAACTHAMLITRDVTKRGERPQEVQKTIQKWRDIFSVFAANKNVPLFAEIHSQQSGTPDIESWDPTFKATLIIQERQDRISGAEFNALAARVAQLFNAVPTARLESWHMRHAPQGFTVVDLPRQLKRKEFYNATKWTPDMLESLLAQLPYGPLAVYGRAPAWVYGALALRALDQPFSQFDARYGWVSPPLIQSGTLRPTQKVIYSSSTDRSHLNPRARGGRYIIPFHIPDYYLDYRDYETGKETLFFSDPPPGSGVIVSGRLPLWIFTALARFYVQKEVCWLALHAADMDRAVVVYSQPQEPYEIGEKILLR
jgi:CRISPR-associated protein Csx3